MSHTTGGVSRDSAAALRGRTRARPATGRRPSRGLHLLAVAFGLALTPLLPLPAGADPDHGATHSDGATAGEAAPSPSTRPSPSVSGAPGVSPSPGPSTSTDSATSPSPSTSPDSPVPATDLGTQLYRQHCASCHGPQGRGTPLGQSLVGVGAASTDFMLSTGRMPYKDQRSFLLHSPSRFAPHEIRAIVEYVDTFGGNGPPIPQVGPGSPVQGQRLFQQYCSACHSATGQGGALTGGRIAPSLSQATPVQVAEAIRTGPYVMPLFPESVLSTKDVDDIAAYVDVLQDERGELDRGGLSFGRVGPFTEGAIGWIGGVLVLVLFARLLGSRNE